LLRDRGPHPYLTSKSDCKQAKYKVASVHQTSHPSLPLRVQPSARRLFHQRRWHDLNDHHNQRNRWGGLERRSRDSPINSVIMAADNEDLDFATLTDDAWKDQEARDEEVINQLSNADATNNVLGNILGKIASGAAISQVGKAANAIDFEDIDLSDEDDLPEEEEATGAHLIDGIDDDDDDLFGDAPSSPPGPDGLRSSPNPFGDGDADAASDVAEQDDDHMDIDDQPRRDSIEDLRALNFDLDADPNDANQDPNISSRPLNKHSQHSR
jgi:hypothetical protein